MLAVSTGSRAQYRNLVFEGGGIRGISYAGALQVLEQEHLLDSIAQAGGTSVGAIVAVLYGVGYTPQELNTLLAELKMQQFNDGRWAFLGGQRRFRLQYGWYRGDALEDWIGTAIEHKTGSSHTTFAQLHSMCGQHRLKDVYVTATNLSRQKLAVFSWKSHPQMELKTAVRTSVSIPLYFRAVLLDSLGNRQSYQHPEGAEVYVDGGLLANYPLTMFDTGGIANPYTLGLKLERPEQLDNSGSEIAPYNISSLSSYVAALYNITIENLNRDSSYASERGRTVYISTGSIGPRVRRMNHHTRTLLYQYGEDGAQQFLKTQVGKK
jgi:NTE family protein